MIKEGKFGIWEAACLTTLNIVSKILYTSTEALIIQAGTAAWYATLVSCFTALFFFFFIYQLMKRFPGKDMSEIFIAVLGNFIGKLLCILLAAYILFYASSHLREFLEMLKTYILPNTAPSIILGSFTAVTVLVAFMGIENIAKLSFICFWLVLSGIFIILILASPYYVVDYAKPFLGYGLGKTFGVGFLRCSAYEEVLILPIVAKSLQNLKDFKKAGVIGLISSGLIFSISFLLNLMAFGYTAASENLSGMFQLSRIIYFNRYFQRIEAIFIFIWVISAVLTVSIAFYASISIYCRAFNIGNHRPLLFPHAFLMFMIAIIPKNISEVLEINMTFVRQYSFPLVFVTPVLILLIAILTGKKGTENAQKNQS